MNKIVESGLKIDLHIHSCFSSKKDGKKVKNNTKETLPLLVKKLNENEVNICSITDHDTFSYELYSELKKSESEDNTILKVLPGVEFSVKFEHSKEEKVIHVVTIFSDNDETKVKNIESILKDFPTSSDGSYSETKFIEILRTIDIDTILIAHQKNSLTSKKPRANDANSLGEEKFFEFVYTDYFEAFEFKNKRNEIINKNYFLDKPLENDLCFVTGTDCHVWDVYPKEDRRDNHNDSFPYTYVKCLPTFRGLVMAMTDVSRLKRVNSFFNVDKHCLDKIIIKDKANKSPFRIPLSRGINVIIGDNSIGKSMLLHALTGYNHSGTMTLDSSTKKGYKNYLKNQGWEIKQQINEDEIFCFDMQGEIRDKFEQNHLQATEFLAEYFPNQISSSQYRQEIEDEVDRMIAYLKCKFKIDDEKKKLGFYRIFIDDNDSESISFIKNLRELKTNTQNIDEIISTLTQISNRIESLIGLGLDEEDKRLFKEQRDLVNNTIKKYTKRKAAIEAENSRVEKIAKVIDSSAKKHSKTISDEQKSRDSFIENADSTKRRIVELLRLERDLTPYNPSIKSKKVQVNTNQIHDYYFVSRLGIETINDDYILSCIKKVIHANKRINWQTITEAHLKSIINRYDDSISVLQFFKDAIMNVVDEDLKIKNSIIFEGMDKYDQLSSGLNARIYFDILSYETNKDGIYIIDQPEDNVSQKSIKKHLIDGFKNMGEIRQVIMVTHNPQFIVNLDVDNIIFLSNENGKILIQSGALEYECNDYKMLDIVANNIDGGIDTIKKRWKRYEKGN